MPVPPTGRCIGICGEDAERSQSPPPLLRRRAAAFFGGFCALRDGTAMPRAYGRTDTNERKMIVDGAAMVYYTVSERFSAEKAGNGALMCWRKAEDEAWIGSNLSHG